MRKKKDFQDERHSDNLHSFERMRSKKVDRSVTAKKKLQRDPFESSEDDWVLQSGETFVARVVEVHKRYCFVSKEPVRGDVDTSDVWLARVARRYLVESRSERNFVVVGDRVLCKVSREDEIGESSELPQCTVEKLSKRLSAIVRRDPLIEERMHVLASNVDQLVIVSSYFNPRVKWGLIDRYLVLAENQGVKPIIVLNKHDLLLQEKKIKPDVFQDFEERAKYYESLGYDVVKLQALGSSRSSIVAKNQKRMRELLTGKVSLFSGHSGVGKSSICNLFDPEIVQDTADDPDIFYKGRHTTSYASFIKLADKTYVIDSPGIRSFIIAHDLATLTRGFVEWPEFAQNCRYRQCTHTEEPICAIRTAVEEGKIPDWRYTNYKGIFLDTTGREGRFEMEMDEPVPE